MVTSIQPDRSRLHHQPVQVYRSETAFETTVIWIPTVWRPQVTFHRLQGGSDCAHRPALLCDPWLSINNLSFHETDKDIRGY